MLSHRSPCWDSLTISLGEIEGLTSDSQGQIGSSAQISWSLWNYWEPECSVLHLHPGSAQHETELHGFLLEVAQVQLAQKGQSELVCAHHTLHPMAFFSKTDSSREWLSSHLLQDFSKQHCIEYDLVLFSASARYGYFKNVLCMLPLYLPVRPSLCAFSISYLNLWLLGLPFPKKPASAFVFEVLGQSHFSSKILWPFNSVLDCNQKGAVFGFWIFLHFSQNKYQSFWLKGRLHFAREEPDNKAFSFSSLLDIYELKYSAAQSWNKLVRKLQMYRLHQDLALAAKLKTTGMPLLFITPAQYYQI